MQHERSAEDDPHDPEESSVAEEVLLERPEPVGVFVDLLGPEVHVHVAVCVQQQESDHDGAGHGDHDLLADGGLVETEKPHPGVPPDVPHIIATLRAQLGGLPR